MSLLKYKLYYSSYANPITYFPIIVKVNDMIVRLIKSKNTSTKEEKFRQLVEYVYSLKELVDDTKVHEAS